MEKKQVVIASAVRTPIGTFGGSLKAISAPDLGAIAVRESLARAGIEGEQVGEVILGNVLQGGLGQNPARQSSLYADLPETVPAMTINKVCGSGLKSVNLAAQTIQLGEKDIVVAGGMENMSRAGHYLDDLRSGKKMGNSELIDLMVHDGLWDVFNDCHMGVTAENLAEKYDISRQAQDEFAAASQNKAEKAWNEGRFEEEIVPVELEDDEFDQDEHYREGVTAEKISGLSPAFKKDGTVTPANASGINDGAAALVLMSAEKAEELGVEPLAYFNDHASAGVDPAIMGIGPVPATRMALERADLTLDDIDLIEANEAFAAQSLAVMQELDLSREIVNVNGGAIALGHPIGASGARILVTLLHEMQKRDVEHGLATLCVGGGHGVTTIVSR